MLVLLAKALLCFPHGSCRGLCAYLSFPFLIASKVATKVAIIFTLIYDMYIKNYSPGPYICIALPHISSSGSVYSLENGWEDASACQSASTLNLNWYHLIYHIIFLIQFWKPMILLHNFRCYSRRNNKELKRTLRWMKPKVIFPYCIRSSNLEGITSSVRDLGAEDSGNS